VAKDLGAKVAAGQHDLGGGRASTRGGHVAWSCGAPNAPGKSPDVAVLPCGRAVKDSGKWLVVDVTPINAR